MTQSNRETANGPDCKVCAHFYVHYEWPLHMIENDGTPVLTAKGDPKTWGSATHCTTCHRTWSVGNDGHCEECHQHFRGVSAFTNHRVDYNEGLGRCLSRDEMLAHEPSESGYTFFLDGKDIWHYGNPDAVSPWAKTDRG